MSIKILLADDSITIQKVVGIIFGGEEYSLTVVDNGKAAVEKARELKPDVLLIDALMPGMSGYEVCEAVRAIPSISSKPILLLTGSFEPFDETKAKSCGADDFLAKPFESQQIVTKVKELIDLGSSRTVAPLEITTSESEAFIPPLASGIAEEPAVANDIWGAFTASEEPMQTAAPALGEDVDAFAMDEEPEGPNASPVAVVDPAEESTGTQWIPVEEETFEFEEQIPVDQRELTVEESMFGDSDFGEVASSPAIPEGQTPPAAMEPEPVTEQPAEAVPMTAPTTVLTEDQLKEALAAASKDVIERIVWEVVPDLAEVLIKEAIRKIKEGQ